MKLALAHALLVGAGGFAGALLRWLLGGLVHRQLPLSTFRVEVRFYRLGRSEEEES